MQKQLSQIFVLTFIALLLQLPGGVFHLYFGRLAYAKDLISIIAVVIGGGYLLRNKNIVNKPYFLVLFLGLVVLQMLPMLLRVDGLLLGKWILLWSVAYLMGASAVSASTPVRLIAVIVLLLYLGVECVIGLWEIRNQRFFLEIANTDVTDAGVELAKMNTLEDVIRVKGLQRNVFQFANLMSLAFVFGMALVAFGRNAVYKIIGLPIGLIAIYCVIKSGGRTALVGCLFSFLVIVLVLNKNIRDNLVWNRILLVIFPLAAVLISVAGPHRLAIYVFDLIGYNGAIANLDSTYIRQEVWSFLWANMLSSPEKLLVGNIVPALMSGFEAPIIIVDNQFLWFLYHFGVFGAFAVLISFYFLLFAAIENAKYDSLARIILILLVAQSSGEALGRDSAFYFSALALFASIGYSSMKNDIIRPHGRGGHVAFHQ